MTASSVPLLLPDTNILVHYARNDALGQYIAMNYRLEHPTATPDVSIVSIGEIRALAIIWKWGSEKRQRVEELLSGCAVIGLDAPGILDSYAELAAYGRSVGRAMGDNDMWIAATARVTGALLLTTDKDFDHLHPTFLRRDWIDPQADYVLPCPAPPDSRNGRS